MAHLARRAFLMGGASALALSQADARMLFDPATDRLRVPGVGVGTGRAGGLKLAMLNNQQQNAMDVSTWRGRHLAMIAPTMPGGVIGISDAEGRFSVQGKPGEPYLLQHQAFTAGDIGTKYNATLTERAGGVTWTQAVQIEVKPYAFSRARWLCAFNLTDPSAVTADANGRMIKAVDSLSGCIMEHPGGAANAPGANAPTFNPAKGLSFASASAQYARISADAVNDPLRALLGTSKPKFAVVTVYRPASIPQDATNGSDAQTLFSFRAGAALSLFARHGVGGSYGLFRGSSGLAVLTSDTGVGQTGVSAFTSNGPKLWVDHNALRMENAPNHDNGAAATITDIDIGRQSAGARHLNGDLLFFGVAFDDICPLEMRAINESLRVAYPGSGIRAVVEYRDTLDFSQFGPALMDTRAEGWTLNADYNTDLVEPTGFTPGRGSGDRSWGIPANDTESALHVDPRHPDAADLGTVRYLPGNQIELGSKPIATAPITETLRAYLAQQPHAEPYKFIGSYIHTRGYATITYGMSETCGINSAAAIGNFPCMMWDIHNGGGHPPEGDDFEGRGAEDGLSTGLHQAPRWPRMGTRMARGRGGHGRASTAKEAHSYQVVKDPQTKQYKYYQDGFLFSDQPTQRGLRENSVVAWRAGLIAGTIDGGAGIVADNGTSTGTLRVSLCNDDHLSPAVFSVQVTGGTITKVYWDSEAPGGTFTPGMYNSALPLVLKRGNQAALTSTRAPDVSMVEVGLNDPKFPSDYHRPMHKISNNAQGGYTGTAPDDNVSAMVVSHMAIFPMRRAAPVVTTAVQNRADAKASDYFSRCAAAGITLDATDRNVLAALYAKTMAAEFRWDEPQDGKDPVWDTSLPKVFDGLGGLALFFGPFATPIDLIDPSVTWAVNGAPSRSSAEGYAFSGAAAGQYLDHGQSWANTPRLANLMRGYDSTMLVALSRDGTASADPMRPILGAGASFRLDLAGSTTVRASQTTTDMGVTISPPLTLPNRFMLRHGSSANAPVDDLARRAMGPGLYTMTKREAAVAVWRNDNRKCPFYASYYGGRDYDTGHSSGSTPDESFRVGSYAAGVRGAAASVALAGFGRWQNEEEVAFLYSLIKPLLLRYSVPGHT